MMKREPDEALIQKIIDNAQSPIFDYLKQEIGGTAYLLGDQPSIADIAITCQLVPISIFDQKG